MITGFRQSTSRICRHCWRSGEEYGVIEGNPTPEQIRTLRHDPKAMRDMDAHEKVCEKNPNRELPLTERVRHGWLRVWGRGVEVER